MEIVKQRKVLNKRVVISCISSLVCLVLLCCLFAGLVKHDLESEKERYSYIAKNEAEHIITTIDCVMARTNTLQAMIQDHNGDTSFFDLVAGDVYRSVKEETGVTLKNFALAPDGVVSDVYPLKGNEALVGFDFLDTTRLGNLEAKEAYEKGDTILTNPFELVQGGMGMGGRAPVILRDGDKEVLWGLVTVTIDYDNLIKVLGLDNLEGMGVNYALSYIDEEGTSHVMHSIGELGDDNVKTRFNVRNLTWELEVSPKKGWISVYMVLLSVLIFLIISGFVGLFTGILLKLRETNETLLHLSVTDQLTGGFNRTSYEAELHKLSERPLDDDLVYVSADVNGLKQINDTLGHLAGDEIIIGAGNCLREAVGKSGKVFRIGGDEFAALINVEDGSLDAILEKLDSLTKKWRGKSVKGLSMSVGHASHNEFPEATVEELIRVSDKRMYDSKRAYYRSEGVDRRRTSGG